MNFLDKVSPQTSRHVQEQTKESSQDLESFRLRLAELAGRAGLKQVAIAQSLSVSEQRVSGWFNGRNKPRGDVSYALARMLGTNVAWLIEGRENKESSQSQHQSQESQPDYGRVKLHSDHELPPREPSAQELNDYAANLIKQARRLPGGLFNLQRTLKRFEKDMIEPIGD